MKLDISTTVESILNIIK